MSPKRITGIVVLIIGVVLIIFSIHSMNRISSAKSEIHSLTSPFSGNSTGKTIGGMMSNKAGQYDTTVMMLLIGGIVLVVVGGSVALFCRKKKSK
jgi:drug/metabolite transporter (DMT)-like permease